MPESQHAELTAEQLAAGDFACRPPSPARKRVRGDTPTNGLPKMNGTGIKKLLAFVVTLVIALTWAWGNPAPSRANHALCPFCSAINMTFWEQIKNHDVVVIARLVELPPPVTDIDAELPKAEFEVTRVLRGGQHLETEARFRVLVVGDYPLGQEFVVMGVNPPGLIWSTPLKATPRLVEYVDKLGTLPEKGPQRLLFFQKYFEDEESVLAYDAYDEFARAPYEDLIAMKDQMDHDQLVAWILDPETTTNRRRLYFTMLGVCGRPADIEILERLIRSEDRKDLAGLDALVACYLNLKGPAGLPLIEEQFLKNEQADYVDTLATISALRFHGTESNVIPRERLVVAIRSLLDRPKMADMIIPDLARWQDWTAMEKLVQLFKDATEETLWVRVPVIQYLQVCPRPEAKQHIEELRKIDPDAVARAALFNEMDFDNSESDSEPKSESSEPSKEGGGKSDGLPPAELAGGLPEETVPTALSQGPLADDPPSRVSSSSAIAPAAVNPAPLAELNTDSDSQKITLKRVPFDIAAPESSLPNAASPLSEPKSATNVETGEPVAPESPETESETFTSLPVEAPANIPSSAVSAPAGRVAGRSPAGPGVWILVYPLGGSALLFALLWSVMHGWFERLIF